MNETRIFQGALLVSLLLHVVLAAVTWRIPFVPEIDPAEAAEYGDEVELLLVDPEDLPPVPEEVDRPTAYTAIPERLASEEPPERADYLALHDAVAADRKQGDSDRPAADEEWEHDKVEVRREDLSGAGGVEYAPVPLPEPEASTGSPAGGDEGEDEEDVAADPQTGQGEWALPSQEREAGDAEAGEQDAGDEAQEKPELDWIGGTPSILKEGDRSASGDRGFDFDQAARGDVGVGVAITGDFSLNTYEWEWAPWMSRFENQLHQHWTAPYAYRLGVVTGYTVIKLVVARDGRQVSLEILETEGHDSLHESSRAALNAFAPYYPLPAGFPEDDLVITIGLHYPAWR